jgi:aspartyl/asparaginyl beta-hydroxylase (cupin superfamily)
MLMIARRPIEQLMFFADRNKTFFDPESFPWAASVEAEWGVVRKELDVLLGRREEIPNFQDLSDAQKYLTEGDQWKTFWLYAYGKKAEENCCAMSRNGASLAEDSWHEVSNVLNSCA